MSPSNSPDLWDKIVDRGGQAACPSCGQASWQGFGDPGNLSVALLAIPRHNEMVEAGSQRNILAVWPFICTNCGFVRLHAHEVLEDATDEYTAL